MINVGHPDRGLKRSASDTASIFYHEGVAVRLGEKLGTGGEGSVFAVSCGGQDVVAKVYHQPLPADQHAKLINMVSCCNESLRAMSAWPVGLLQVGRKGPVRGFLMPRLIGYQAVHNVYGPAPRKAKYPKADWAFLVQVARNIAAAFDTIHANGHVIGDVNQGNVLVANNALVKLIDCDSFQISVPGLQFLCDVGVPHFTSPELLRAVSLRGLQRTLHHDNFGLAVLVFHLLLMGRHPFAGVYAGAQDMPIELAIKESRYAFGRNAAASGMSRPPGSAGPEILTAELSELFEQAFCKDAERAERPAAHRWVQALDGLKREIRTCGAEPMHRYYGKLPVCPWCDIEKRQGVVFFVGAVSVQLARPANFDLQSVWASIEAAKTAVPALPVAPSSIAATGTPVPLGIKGRCIVSVTLMTMIVATAIVLAAAAPRLLVLWTMLAFLLWRTESNTRELAGERERRKRELRIAERRWIDVEHRWRVLSGDELRSKKLEQLAAAKCEYERTESGFLRARQQLQEAARSRRLSKFLAQFAISKTAIAQISADQIATLSAHGIETAADIDWVRMAKIRRFVGELTSHLMTWRRTLEAGFRFDATRDLDPAELQALTVMFAQRRKDLASVLVAGPEELQRIVIQHEAQRRAFTPSAEDSARTLAQARADFGVVS